MTQQDQTQGETKVSVEQENQGRDTKLPAPHIPDLQGSSEKIIIKKECFDGVNYGMKKAKSTRRQKIPPRALPEKTSSVLRCRKEHMSNRLRP